MTTQSPQEQSAGVLSYEAWRISYQSSEAAARAAYLLYTTLLHQRNGMGLTHDQMQLPPFDADLRKILGSPGFVCGQVSTLLRRNGQQIPRKMEEEQAAVIYWLLNLHAKHKSLWAEEAQKELGEIVAKGKEATA